MVRCRCNQMLGPILATADVDAEHLIGTRGRLDRLAQVSHFV